MRLKIDDIKKLQQKKYRSELGYFLVEGEHLVLELEKAARDNQNLRDCELWVTENFAEWNTELHKNIISEKQMAQISETKSPQGIIAVAPLCFLQQERQKQLQKPPGERAIYLHEIQDPGNLGTILRSLAWFGNFRCLLSSNSVDPFNGKVVRSSMGAIFHVPIELDVALESIRDRFATIAYLDMQGANLSSPDFAQCDCYLFGNEARGVPREALESMVTGGRAKAFSIQGCGAIESLNLASVVNICAYELHR